MNLLHETIEILKEHNKFPEDVLWIGNKKEYSISWKEFETIADIEYDDDYGIEEIYRDLIVVGKDFWLERHEYDGSEWWEYKEMPIQPINPKSFKFIKRGSEGEYYGKSRLSD